MALKRKAKKIFLAQKVRQGQRQKNLLMKTLDFSDPATSEKFRHLSLMTATGHFEAAKDESARENPIVPTLLTVSDPPRKILSTTSDNDGFHIPNTHSRVPHRTTAIPVVFRRPGLRVSANWESRLR